MINHFIKNSLIYGVGRFVTLLVGLGIIPIMTHTLPASEFGLFDIVYLCLMFLNLSVALEISQAIVRFMADCVDQREKQSYVSTAFLFSLGMYTLMAIGLYAIRDEFSQLIFKSENHGYLVSYLIIWLYLQGTNTFISNQLRWENKPAKQSILQISIGVALLVAVYVFLVVLPASVDHLIYAYLASQCVGLLMSIYFSITERIFRATFSTQKLWAMLAFSTPLVFSSLSVFAQNYIDRAMIAHLLDFADLGLYALSFRIAAFMTVLAGIFHLSITPLIYKHYKDDNTPTDIANTANIYAACMILVAFCGALFLPEIYILFIGDEFLPSLLATQILMFSVVVQGFYVFLPGLSIAKKTSMIACVNIAGMVVNVAMNYLMIPVYGIMGAAVATMISSVLVVALYAIVSRRHYTVPIQFLKLVSVFTATAFGAYVLGRSVDALYWNTVMIKLMACGFGTAIIWRWVLPAEMKETLMSRLKL